MNRKTFLLLTLLTLITVTGCKEPDFKAENRALTDRIETLSKENLELNSKVKVIEAQLDGIITESERIEAERNGLAIELNAIKSKSTKKRRRRR